MVMTPSASPTLDTQKSEPTSRALVDLLLDDGEQTALQDTVAIETCDMDVFDEAVTGWGCSVSLPKHAAKSLNSNPRAKKGSKPFPPDIDIANIRIRCVSDDYSSDHQRSTWKANVEPGTYRYICNNGIYRATKFANVGDDWVTAKRSKHPDSSGLTVTPEVRQAQKLLKKDLSHMLRTTETAKSEPGTRNTESLANRSENNPHTHTKASSAVALNEPISRPVTKETVKDPKLVKSASDLFVEKFSTRIDALKKSEKELQASSAPRTPITPSKSGVNHLGKRQEQQLCNDSAQQATDDIAKDVFTVKSVTKMPADQPLRPLEKLTPQQKSMDRGSGSECSSRNSRSEVEQSPLLPTSFMSAMNAFAQLHHQSHRGQDSSKKSKSGPSTYRSHHKNSLGSASGNSNFSDNDSISSVRNALTMTNSSIERMRMKPYARDTGAKDYAVKDYGRFLTGKYRLGSSSLTSKKPPLNVQRKGIVGYKPTIIHSQGQMTSTVPTTMASPTHLVPTIQPVVLPSSTDDIGSNVSESSESYLSGTSMTVHRGSGGQRDPKPGSMALPEISGKRLAVAMSSQRML